jgi:putative ubiquitin-RnfH superfamily antitoxin RatB of RatAB toxin-antitoxin module
VASLRVEVVYARADAQDLVALELAEGTTAGQAAEASGLLARHGLAAADLVLGNFGRRIASDCPLRDGDRVEILRALAMDPKEARRRRAARTRRRRRRRRSSNI